MIYIFVFIATIFSIFYAERFLDSGKKLLFLILSIIGILMPCILAGLRNENVGIDLRMYVIPAYKDSLVLNYKDYMLLHTKEQLYYTFAYLCSHVGSSPFFYLFINELVIIVPVYIALVKLRKDLSITLAMGVFLFLFYNFSLCYMRQFCAISVLFLASTYLFEKRILVFIILSIIGFFLHVSSILLAFILLLCFFANTKVKKFLVVGIVVVVLFFSYQFINTLCSIGIIPYEYLDRFNETSSNNGINWGELFLYTILYFLPIVFVYKNLEDFKYINFYFICFFIGWIMILASSLISIYFYRLTFNFRFFVVIELATFIKSVKFKEFKDKIYFISFIFIICLIHWWRFTIHINVEETFPYEMMLRVNL